MMELEATRQKNDQAETQHRDERLDRAVDALAVHALGRLQVVPKQFNLESDNLELADFEDDDGTIVRSYN